jgi:hypothetical protein
MVSPDCTRSWRGRDRSKRLICRCRHERGRLSYSDITHMLRSTVVFARRYSTRQRVRTVARYTGYLGLSAVIGVASLTGAILIHDCFTYSNRHVHRVPVNPLALNPERGGPKNLPIARILVGDDEDDDAKLLGTKPKLVIVGGGWGVSFQYTCFSS